MMVTLKILKYDPKTDEKGHIRSFRIPYLKGMTILDGLIFIRKWRDPTLCFRWECRSGICGTCAVMYNQKPVLACKTLINPKTMNQIKPLRNFPVEKDLIVDFSFILKQLERINPFLYPGGGRIESKADADKSKAYRKCIECGCCIAGVIKHQGARRVLNPLALVKLARFCADPRDIVNRRKIAQTHGISTYTKKELQKLSNLCPQEISLEEALGILSR